MERSITNTGQGRLAKIFRPGRRYDPLWAWNEAKKIDEWADTNPGDDNGTSVSAFYDVARTLGLRRIDNDGITVNLSGKPVIVDSRRQPDISEGILENRWATSIDEMRTAIAQGLPVTIGVNWYANFDAPVKKETMGWGWANHWIGEGPLGRQRGGHSVCVYGAHDKFQAFRLKNSWGRDYPLVWISYEAMQLLLDEYGEAALVTDL